MALINLKDLLNHASKKRYAVGAFNVTSMTFIDPIIEAAIESNSPVTVSYTHLDVYKRQSLDIKKEIIYQAGPGFTFNPEFLKDYFFILNRNNNHGGGAGGRFKKN